MKKAILLLLLFCALAMSAQQRQVQRAAVGFLNVENLWDTIPSADFIDGTLPATSISFHRSIPVDSVKFLNADLSYKGPWNDEVLAGKKVVRFQGSNEEFTPKSPKHYNTNIYSQKLSNEARVISELGRAYTNDNPAIVGLIEVENRQVVQDLIRQPALAKSDYGIVHYNSYDYRGIDVAIIYQKKRFTPSDSYKKEVKIFDEDGKREYTRDILVVKGMLDGEPVAVLMNHWPSRRGGEAASQDKRNAAAAILKSEMDRITAADPNVKILAMGDFNDDPVSPSLRQHLAAVGTPQELSERFPYYNLMAKLYKAGIASLAYRDAPNLFDQIIVSRNLYSAEKITPSYSVYKAEIYAPNYLVNSSGQFKGYPFRSWDGDRFTGGYSDHFPAVSILQREYVRK